MKPKKGIFFIKVLVIREKSVENKIIILLFFGSAGVLND